MRRIALTCCFIMGVLSSYATIVLPNVFAHHMVLQREQPVAIFGQAHPGERITVRFQGQSKRTSADAEGNWKLWLSPMKANAAGADLIIAGENTIVLRDVLVGEVWICSGQSNMEYQMRKLVKLSPPKNGTYFPKDEVKNARNTQIRLFLVRRKFLAKPDGTYTGWSIAQDSALRQFSAAGYFFAKSLQQELQVPVGIISSAVSGSRIEPWIPKEALDREPYFRGRKLEGDPGKFFETMIAPLAPYTIKGFLWYQGETNVFLQETISYTHKLKTLIESWREGWGTEKLPFYFTQIAPFQYSVDEQGKTRMPRTTLPEFREAQDLVLQVKHTGRIATTDLVDHVHDLHPSYKWEIGRRLALQALKKTYHRSIEADGPTYKYFKRKGNSASIFFVHAAGLQTRDGQSPTGFEVAGTDRIFYPASARIQGQTVVVTAPQVETVAFVRFAWDEAAQPNLVNAAGLPALPFRSTNPHKKLKR
ncbi:sialate O-acetylesterase [Sphingobacterium suaedae]|uniref:Sialate O-acetylesterase n=1 Tax=Sphingobacterium suaedae TaxID=1686402 RepID=A0ABW5KLP7_9SPHI